MNIQNAMVIKTGAKTAYTVLYARTHSSRLEGRNSGVEKLNALDNKGRESKSAEELNNSRQLFMYAARQI